MADKSQAAKKPNGKATGSINVLKAPALTLSAADKVTLPLELRDAFVGLIIPCFPYIGTPRNADRYGVRVPQDEAIAILLKRNAALAGQWLALGYGKTGETFFFAEDEFYSAAGLIEGELRISDTRGNAPRHYEGVN